MLIPRPVRCKESFNLFVTGELSRLGIDSVVTIPWDEEVYEYDLKLKSFLDLPDTSKAVREVKDLIAKLLNKK